MTRSLFRTAVLGVLALAIAFGALAGFTDLLDPVAASADTLSTDDLLPTTFSDETGLSVDTDLESTIGKLIKVVLGFLGIVCVLIVLWGGFEWMTAGGNDDKVRDAKKRLIAGVIGMAIIFSAYAITSFVIGELLSATA